jgi:hypothetical protein
MHRVGTREIFIAPHRSLDKGRRRKKDMNGKNMDSTFEDYCMTCLIRGIFPDVPIVFSKNQIIRQCYCKVENQFLIVKMMNVNSTAVEREKEIPLSEISNVGVKRTLLTRMYKVLITFQNGEEAFFKISNKLLVGARKNQTIQVENLIHQLTVLNTSKA